MALSQMQIFNDYVIPATMETLGQMVQKFNAASNGTIRLTAEGFDGDFMQTAFYSAIHSAQRRVDRYAAQAAASATDLTQVKDSGVKIAGAFGPIKYEPSQMTWQSPQQGANIIERISMAMAESIMRDQLNSAIAALRAAIANQAAATFDYSATGGLSYSVMNNAHAKFGDASGTLAASVMTGQAYHKLIGQNLTNAQNLFQSSNVLVVNVLGKPVVVTDAPALYVAGTPNKLHVLSLVEGAATVYDGSQIVTNVQTVNGLTRIETTFQADYDFGLKIKGYSWDETNGGKSPTDAELATGSNWDKVATDIKHTAGVCAIASDA